MGITPGNMARPKQLLGRLRTLVLGELASRVARRLDDRFHIAESRWRSRGEEDARSYWESDMNRVRAEYLANVLTRYQPRSVLEVGCNCGNILFHLSRRLPLITMTGIDLNGTAIRKGREWLAKAGAHGITLVEGSAEELEVLVPNSHDIVFSAASLIYVPPVSIASVLSAMIRSSRKAVVLMEMQTADAAQGRRALGEFCRVRGVCEGNWKRDYPTIIRDLELGVTSISVTWVPREVWMPGGGGAALVEVRR